MLKILKYLEKKDWTLVVFAIIFIVTQVWLDLKLPDYMSEITILVQTKDSSMRDIFNTGRYMMLSAIGSLVASFMTGYFAAVVAANLSWKLRDLLYKKV